MFNTSSIQTRSFFYLKINLSPIYLFMHLLCNYFDSIYSFTVSSGNILCRNAILVYIIRTFQCNITNTVPTPCTGWHGVRTVRNECQRTIQILHFYLLILSLLQYKDRTGTLLKHLLLKDLIKMF